MKHEEYGEMWKGYWDKKAPRSPAYSIKELCLNLNVDPRIMNGKLNRSDAPKPVFYGHTKGKERPFFNHNEFIAWWKKVMEEKE